MKNLLFMSLAPSELILLTGIGVLLIYSIIDITRSKFRDPINKVVWIVIILVLPILGPLLYLMLGLNQKVARNI